MAPRIDIEQRLAQRDVAECLHELDGHLFAVNRDRNILAAAVAQLEKIFRVDVYEAVADLVR